MDLTHKELCDRAAAWLRANRRCDPVLTKVASCAEIPDAIGWSSNYRYRGSIVVECKTSRSDFRADKQKYVRYRYRAPGVEYDNGLKTRLPKRYVDAGYVPIAVPRMGNFRFFMCPPEIITAEMVKDSAPDHGLLWCSGKKVHVVIEGPRRLEADYATEVHYLRFALIHLRDNLLGLGFAVNTTEATKFFGKHGITAPEKTLFAAQGRS